MWSRGWRLSGLCEVNVNLQMLFKDTNVYAVPQHTVLCHRLLPGSPMRTSSEE